MKTSTRVRGLIVAVPFVIGGLVAALPSASATAGSATVSVPASASGGVASGITVTAGDHVTISASGTAGYGYEGAAGCVGYPTTYPNGSRYVNGVDCGPKLDPNAQLSGNAIGLLIMRVGTGAWQPAASFTATTSGVLVLAYNDSYYPDNTGGYTVSVSDDGAGGSGTTGGTTGGSTGGSGGTTGGCPHGCPQ